MLFNVVGNWKDETRTQMEIDFRTALGDPTPHSNFSFSPQFKDVPNVKFCTEYDFWGHRSSWTPKADVWCGQQHEKIEIDGVADWRHMHLFWDDHGNYKDGGYGVLWCYNRKETHYFTWRACDHEFASRNVGNCLTEYKCTKCGATHEIDSSG